MRDTPGHRPGRPCVYVGETSKSPDERFDQHMAGGRLSSAIVRKYGRRLRPEDYAHIPPVRTRAESMGLEDALGRELRRRGYAAHWNEPGGVRRRG